MRTIRDILIGLILGAAVGGGGLWLYWQYQQQVEARQQMERERKDARQAHKDSLMQIRARQDAEEQAATRTETKQKAVCTYLERFYADVVLGQDGASLRKFLTDSCKREPSAFLPMMDNNDKVKASIVRNLKVSHDHDDWYRVRLVVDGVTTYRYLKIRQQGDEIKIDDVI